MADGIDATRLSFGVTDKYGAPRAFGGGDVSFQVEGKGVLIGDNPFPLADAGGLAAVWVKTIQHEPGQVKVTATHSVLGTKAVEIKVRPDVKTKGGKLYLSAVQGV